MKAYLRKLPKDLQAAIKRCAQIAAKDDISAYLVGGFVRDMLIGKPNLDLDLAVAPDAIKFAGHLAKDFNAHLVCHKRFCTATVHSREQNIKIDIATLRKETYPKPGALPVVSAGTLRDDLARRDFTINAMAVSLKKEESGRLIDFFDGNRDLKEKKIRVLHPLSFIDDPTRIFRAVRFEQRYGFCLEAQTLKLLRAAVKKGMVGIVQPERLRNELELLLKEPDPAKYAARINALVGFDFLSPRLTFGKKTVELLKSIGRQIAWFNQTYPNHRRLDGWLIYLMGILDSLTPAALERVLARFPFHRGQTLRLRSAKGSLKPQALLRLKAKTIPAPVLFALLEPLSYEVIIFLKAKHADRDLEANIENFFQSLHGVRPQVSGEDLKRLGIAPGPHYQQIFAKVLNARLKGKVSSKEEELGLVLRIVPVRRRKALTKSSQGNYSQQGVPRCPDAIK